MPGGEGQVGGRGDREGSSFPGYRRDAFIAMTGAWGEKQHIDCWILMLFWMHDLKACISKVLSDNCAILWCWAIRFWCSLGSKQSFLTYCILINILVLNSYRTQISLCVALLCVTLLNNCHLLCFACPKGSPWILYLVLSLSRSAFFFFFGLSFSHWNLLLGLYIYSHFLFFSYSSPNLQHIVNDWRHRSKGFVVLKPRLLLSSCLTFLSCYLGSVEGGIRNWELSDPAKLLRI